MINSPMSGKPMRFQHPNTRLAVSIGHPSMHPHYVDSSGKNDLVPHGPSRQTASKVDEHEKLPIDVSAPGSGPSSV